MPPFLSTAALLLLLLLSLPSLHSLNIKADPNKKPTNPTNSTSSSKLNKATPTHKPNQTTKTPIKPQTQKNKPNAKALNPKASSFLEILSATSNLYLSKTRRHIAAGVKPFVGNKYAAASSSLLLLLLPLLLVTALFRHLLRTGTSASLHRALFFIQAYLAIYFATLSLTAAVTGLEPLRFLYAASPAAYAWTQASQTFGYLVYLVAQLIALAVAFSAGEGKAVGMGQMLLGLSVGMHYYVTVFHRAVTGEAPRANWKVHGVYAVCFVGICGLGRAGRRKKAYLDGDGGDDSKKS